MSNKQNRRNFLKGSFVSSSAGLVAGAVGGTSAQAQTDQQKVGEAPSILSMDRTRVELFEYMKTLPVIDAHTHIRPEAWRLRWPMSALTLFGTHPALDAKSSAGVSGNFDPPFSQPYTYLNDGSIPLRERWNAIKPYLANARFGSFYRGTKIALRDIYDVDDITDDNVEEVTERIQAENKPGIYQKILRERSNIQTCLVQCSGPQFDELAPLPLLTRIYSGPTTYKHNISAFVKQIGDLYGTQIEDLDTFLEILGKFLKERKEKDGAAGFKIYTWGDWMYVDPDLEESGKDFKKTLAEGVPTTPVLEATIKDHVFKLCAEWDWPVSAHGGGNYMDFRKFDTRKLIDIIMRHPETRFDLFHLGIPFPLDFIFIAKSFPNITLNLVWAQALSEWVTRDCINQILDAVPINKVIAFGSDAREHIEIAYGYLTMMRELMAEALSERIARGRLNMEDAKYIAKIWFYDNPAEIYRLS